MSQSPEGRKALDDTQRKRDRDEACFVAFVSVLSGLHFQCEAFNNPVKKALQDALDAEANDGGSYQGGASSKLPSLGTPCAKVASFAKPEEVRRTHRP